MQHSEAVSSRRSTRRFKKREVPREILEKIVGEGIMAPSALNRQPWRFIAVVDPGIRQRVRGVYGDARERRGLYKQDTSFLADGALIIALYERGSAAPELSTALACENILLAAVDAGLSAVLMTALLDGQGSSSLAEMFGIPGDYGILAVIAIGYAGEEPAPKPRKSLSEVLSYDRF